ncbi:MAG TPA: prepilin-type N-terminal cleavage/methylation domain-containing protein [Polyangiaceae bacterium]|nr:prepilin-type N-terminal cleavage/methylation domain-containing protein [Polyangiaceae bacterium]
MKARARGYTVIELMMSLAVFATGVTGVIAMERATVSSNQLAKNVAIANAVAQSWLSQLAADSTLWTTQWSVTQTTWLSTVTANDGLWQLPVYDTTRAFGPEFDGFGAPTTANPAFCAQIRLTWLYGDASPSQATGIPGNGVIRTEVRVFWPHEQVGVDTSTRFATDCSNAAPATVNAVTDGTYHMIVQASAVRQPD